MKFNWGHGLFVTILFGVAGIMTLVFLSSREKIDLVTEDYYPRELVYEKQIEKQKNTQKLNEKVFVFVTDTIIFQFPDISKDPFSIEGEILFYRPSDRAFDRKEILRLDSLYRQEFRAADFPSGKYEVILEWECDGIEYLQKEILFIP